MAKSQQKGGCPICGASGLIGIHRCAPKSLAAIDAADARAWNGPSNLADPMRRSEGERIAAGAEELRRLAEDGWPYPYTKEVRRG